MTHSFHGKVNVPLAGILQGQLATSAIKIFLFPDGGASGQAYGKLPLVHPEVCLNGMNSPFLANANKYTCSIEKCTRV
jgi:thioesterase domain-containing protein